MSIHADLEQQLFNPQHCYIEVRPGVWFAHSDRDRESPVRHLYGRPVRFTRLAGEKVLAGLHKNGNLQARLVEE